MVRRRRNRRTDTAGGAGGPSEAKRTRSAAVSPALGESALLMEDVDQSEDADLAALRRVGIKKLENNKERWLRHMWRENTRRLLPASIATQESDG